MKYSYPLLIIIINIDYKNNQPKYVINTKRNVLSNMATTTKYKVYKFMFYLPLQETHKWQIYIFTSNVFLAIFTIDNTFHNAKKFEEKYRIYNQKKCQVLR